MGPSYLQSINYPMRGSLLRYMYSLLGQSAIRVLESLLLLTLLPI